MQGASPLASLGLNPGGTGAGGRTTRPAGGLPGWLPVRRALAAPCGGLPSLPPAYPAFSFVFAPISPAPFPAGRGGPKVYFAGGFAPGTPALNRLRHLQTLPNRYPAHGSLRFNAKPKEPPFHEQCRQPRRGGTGGEELRRLRWSSPPGRGGQAAKKASSPPRKKFQKPRFPSCQEGKNGV